MYESQIVRNPHSIPGSRRHRAVLLRDGHLMFRRDFRRKNSALRQVEHWSENYKPEAHNSPPVAR